MIEYTLLAIAILVICVMAYRMRKLTSSVAGAARDLKSDEMRDAMLFSMTEATKLADEMTAAMTVTREQLAEDARVALAILTAKEKAEAIAARLAATLAARK